MSAAHAHLIPSYLKPTADGTTCFGLATKDPIPYTPSQSVTPVTRSTSIPLQSPSPTATLTVQPSQSATVHTEYVTYETIPSKTVSNNY